MHKLFSVVLALTLAVWLPLGASAADEKVKVVKILTAIDVATLIENGASNADIVRILSEQRGVDPAAPALKGKSEQQKILLLLNLPEPAKKDADKGKTSAHRTAGEDSFKKKDYAKAAQEFSLATKYMVDNLDIYKHELFKLRGDSYKELLRSGLSPSTPEGQEESKKPFFDQKRVLLCGAVYADYRTASVLLDKSIRDGITEVEARNVRMKELKEGKDPTLQFKTKSNEYINIMRDMRRILYRQSSAKSAAKHLKLALEDYGKVCPAEEQARRDLVREARDKSRDRKWVKYGEIDDASYFYDKASLKKTKDGVTVWSRKETFDDDTSHDLLKLRLDCGKKKSRILETAGYGTDGKQTSKKEYKKPVEKTVVPGTPEVLLMDSICR